MISKEEYLAEVESSDTDDNDVYHRLFKLGVELSGKTHSQLATKLSLAVPTVAKHLNGLNLPHRLGRKSILKEVVADEKES